jgi:hypothetical protein
MQGPEFKPQYTPIKKESEKSPVIWCENCCECIGKRFFPFKEETDQGLEKIGH